MCVDRLNYCERFLEMLIDLETSLPTRRFFHIVLDDVHLIDRCYLASLSKRDEGHLFKQVCLFIFNQNIILIIILILCF